MTPYRAASITLVVSKVIAAAIATATIILVFLALSAANVSANWLIDHQSDRINNGFEFSQPSPAALEPAPEVEAPAALQRKAPVAKPRPKAHKPVAKKAAPVARPVRRQAVRPARPAPHVAPKTPSLELPKLEAPMPSIVNPYTPPQVEAPVAPPAPAPKAEAPVKRKAHIWSCDPNVKHHFFKFCDAH